MASVPPSSLDALIPAVARGEPAAVRAMVDGQLPRMVAVAWRMLGDPAEAEDVAQEVMLRAWRQVPRWRPGRARFDTWMHQVALNLCRDRLRRRRPITMAEPPETSDASPDAEDTLLNLERDRRVNAALAALPERQREAVVLCHYQGLSGRDAAVSLGLSVEALESLLARARRGLSATLMEAGDDA